MFDRLRGVGLIALLILAIGTGAVSTCTAGEVRPEMQMACCKGGHHDCGSSGDPMQCCKKQKPQEQQFFAATKQAPAPAMPMLYVVFAQACVEYRIQPLTVGQHSRGAPIAAPSPPIYVLTSTFLI